MKSLTIFLLLFSLFRLSAQDTLRLKAEMKIGQPGFTGHFPIVNFTRMSDENPWKGTEQKLSGIPSDWDDWFRQDVWFQTYQFAYQNYKAGNMDSARFAGLMQSWKFDPVPPYTKDWIACHTTLIYHWAADSTVQYMVDTDVDYDFSDEVAYIAVEGMKYQQADSLIENSPWVRYEMCLNGKVRIDSVPFLVKQDYRKGVGDFIGYIMPLYGQAVLGIDTLILNSMRPDFEDFTVSLLTELESGANKHLGQKKETGSRILLSGDWYTIEDFDRATSELILTEVDIERDTIYPSTGFYAPDFTLKEVDTGKQIQLQDFKGKYVLLDFWGTWCKGCILALPEMVRMKNELEGCPFEMVSIACFSNKEQFEQLKAKYGMDWHHCWQMTKEGVIADYAVENYPSMFLIDPNGKIVGYNLSVEEIKGTVKNKN